MKRLIANWVQTVALSIALLVACFGHASALDPSFGNTTTFFEPGVDLSPFLANGSSAPSVTLDAFGNGWVIATKGSASPTLVRFDRAGNLDASATTIGGLPTFDHVALSRDSERNLVMCGIATATMTVHMVRLAVNAAGSLSRLTSGQVAVPQPYAVSNPITLVTSPVTLSNLQCTADSANNVAVQYSKSGSGIGGSPIVFHRFDANGGLDLSFGDAGTIMIDGTFQSVATTQLGVITLTWVGEDRAINIVSEGAIVQMTIVSAMVHPAALIRIEPPTVSGSKWTITQRDLTFAVAAAQSLPLATAHDGNDVVFLAQRPVANAAGTVDVYRVDARNGLVRELLVNVRAPIFTEGPSRLVLAPIAGTLLAVSGNGVVSSTPGDARISNNTLWIGRFSYNQLLQGVAGGVRIDALNGEIRLVPLDEGGFLVSAATVTRRDGAPASPGIVRVSPDYLLPRTVEFYDPDRGNYFFAASTAEIEQIWAWIRSGILKWKPVGADDDGQSFKTWPSDVSNAQTTPVCRFFLPSLATHFYSARSDECAKFARPEYAKLFQLEDPLFAVSTPNAAGGCPAGKAVVRRFFRPPPAQPNHRWVRDDQAAKTMRARGWLDEGPVFCEPSY